METRDYTWAIIRLLGLYLLIQSIIAIPALAGAILYMYDYCTEMHINNSSGNDVMLQKGLRMALRLDLVRSALAVTLYGVLGVYFMFGGKLVHRWIGQAGKCTN